MNDIGLDKLPKRTISWGTEKRKERGDGTVYKMCRVSVSCNCKRLRGLTHVSRL